MDAQIPITDAINVVLWSVLGALVVSFIVLAVFGALLCITSTRAALSDLKRRVESLEGPTSPFLFPLSMGIKDPMSATQQALANAVQPPKRSSSASVTPPTTQEGTYL